MHTEVAAIGAINTTSANTTAKAFTNRNMVKQIHDSEGKVKLTLEVGHGGGLRFVAGTPLGEETDREAAEHPQDPDGVAVSDTALLFVG